MCAEGGRWAPRPARDQPGTLAAHVGLWAHVRKLFQSALNGSKASQAIPCHARAHMTVYLPGCPRPSFRRGAGQCVTHVHTPDSLYFAFMIWTSR